MAASSQGFHENPQLLSSELQDRHRAIVSIMEELEAVDWYDQRVAAATDVELAAILAHNRDEEKEHASMVLEWLRRHDPKWDENLRRYLFRDVTPLEVEAAAESGPVATDAATAGGGSLGIGPLKGTTNL